MSKYISPIDPHVHLRGTEYTEDYLALGLRDARAVGMAAVIEQPNPQPWLTSEETVKARVQQAAKAGYGADGNPWHRVHIGLTNDPDQVIAALKLIQQGAYGLRSDKVFYTHSTGNMGLLDPDKQQWIWNTRGRIGYQGVSIGHFEDEKHFAVPFDPADPLTHSLRQCPEAEVIQVERQLRFASDAGFTGTFYIAHLSNPQTLELVKGKTFLFKVVTEMSWHHALLNHDDYQTLGNRVKMNPPLRSKVMQEALLGHLLAGNIDVIGTDHAPHPLWKKDDLTAPASGIAAIAFWPRGIEILRQFGIRESLLEALIFHNANRIFQLGLTPREVEAQYQPSLWEAYGFDPFARLAA